MIMMMLPIIQSGTFNSNIGDKAIVCTDRHGESAKVSVHSDIHHVRVSGLDFL